jgi:Uma2 family endonuclease
MKEATILRQRPQAMDSPRQEMGWPYLDVGAAPRIDHLITEDDTPVDNIFSAKQQRLLVESLYSSWGGPGSERIFLVDANVGLFYTPRQPPIVPDVFLSLDVQVAPAWWEKRHRSYFFWEFGKPPEVVIEIVSNLEGEEDTDKLLNYAGMGVLYYVIFDPLRLLSESARRIYRLTERGYRLTAETWFEPVGLGAQLWEGEYEGLVMEWLRWYGPDGLIPTGAERAEQERRRAEQERRRAEQERRRAEQEQRRAEQLAAQLRALGVEPNA